MSACVLSPKQRLALTLAPARWIHEGYQEALAEALPAGVLGKIWGQPAFSRWLVTHFDLPLRLPGSDAVLAVLLCPADELAPRFIKLGLWYQRVLMRRSIEGRFWRRLRQELEDETYAFILSPEAFSDEDQEPKQEQAVAYRGRMHSLALGVRAFLTALERSEGEEVAQEFFSRLRLKLPPELAAAFMALADEDCAKIAACSLDFASIMTLITGDDDFLARALSPDQDEPPADVDDSDIDDSDIDDWDADAQPAAISRHGGGDGAYRQRAAD